MKLYLLYAFSSHFFSLIYWTEARRGLSDITDQVCGIGGDDGSKIVAGTESYPGEFPWMAAIFLKGRFGGLRLFCGGSLIDSYHILTAAHCVDQTYHRPKPSDLLIKLNEFNVNRDDELAGTLTSEVRKIFVHPKWNEKEFRDDLAILRLKEKIDYSPDVRPICLPKNSDVYDTKTAVVSGWGVTKEGGTPSPTLRKANVTVEKNRDCSSKYKGAVPFQILSTNICASDPPRDACQNDSGGPLQTKREDGRYEQIGIVSWGIGCGDQRYPGVYARVTSYLDWIKQVTNPDTFVD